VQILINVCTCRGLVLPLLWGHCLKQSTLVRWCSCEAYADFNISAIAFWFSSWLNLVPLHTWLTLCLWWLPRTELANLRWDISAKELPDMFELKYPPNRWARSFCVREVGTKRWELESTKRKYTRVRNACNLDSQLINLPPENVKRTSCSLVLSVLHFLAWCDQYICQAGERLSDHWKHKCMQRCCFLLSELY